MSVDVLPGLPRPDVATVAAPLDLSQPTPLMARAGETIREIFDRQNFILPTIALLNGTVMMRGSWDEALAVGSTLLFLQLPAGGDGKKDIFRFVLQLAITVVAAYFLGPAGVGLTGGALQAGVAVATLAGGYLVNLALPPTSADSVNGLNSGLAASPTYSLTPQGNQARLGSTIPRVYGRHLLVPDLATQPYTEYVGNDLYLYELFSLGLGLNQVHQVRIARTEVWNEDDGYNDAFDDIEIEIVDPGNPVTLFPTEVVTTVEVSGQTLKGINEDGAGAIGPYAATGPLDEPNYIAFDFAFRGGAGHLTDSGAITERTIIIRQEIQEIDSVGDPIGDWVTLDETPFSFSTRTAQRISRRYPLPGGRWQAKCTRINAAATSTRDWDEVTWDALRGYLPSDDTYPCQVMAVKMRASNQLSSQAARDFTVVETSMLPTWDGEAWSTPVATRSIFDAAMDVLRNDSYSAARPDDRIDIDALFSMHETWTSRGETFDGVFDQSQTVWDVLTDILRVGRARPIEIGDTISFVRDEKQTVAKMMLTPRQVLEGTFSIDYALFDPQTPDDVMIEYVDERTWDTAATVRATLPGSTSTNPVRQNIKGIVDRTRAWQYGCYLAAGNKYRREFVSAGTEFDGRLLSPLDLVPVAHPLCDWGRSADIVNFDDEAGTLTLSQKPMLDAVDDNYMLLRQTNGKPWGPVLVVAGADEYSVTMDVDDLASVVGTQGDPFDFITSPDSADALDDDIEPTVAVFGHGEMYQRDCKLMGIRKQGASNITLTLFVDDDRVYEAGETGAPPDEGATATLPVIPKGPDIERIDVVVRGTLFHPIIDVSVRPAPGTLNYIYQISYDHVHYQTLQDGLVLTWSGEVSPTTVWIRVTAIGSVRGTPKEWYQDLTVGAAAPAAVSGISIKRSLGNAWVKFTLSDDDGIEGVIAKYSDTEGFDPETEGTMIDYGLPVTEVTIPTATAHVYVRIAAYNPFGKAGLNWSSELDIESLALTEADIPDSVLEALATAESYGDSIVFKVTDEVNNAGGFVLQSTGESVTAAWLVDNLLVATPGGHVPLLVLDEDGLRTNSIITSNITTDTLKAKVADADVIRAGRYMPLEGDALDINTKPGEIYFSMKRPE